MRRASLPPKVEIPPLIEWIPKLSPRYEPPRHLAPLIEVLEGILRGEQHRVVVHTPPRHGKTETLLHWVAWGLRQRPDLQFGYASYADDIASSKSRIAQDLAVQAGVQLRTSAVSEWLTEYRGGFRAVGVNGGLTGHGLNIGIIDDPVKDRLQAESATYRERVWDWFQSVFATRMEPGGSVIVNMARWHPEDLAGKLVKAGWRYICLPAISDEGKALWPERWSVDSLRDKRETIGEYNWASLFQGSPRPRGGSVFGDPHSYSELPSEFRTAIGVDLSYTAKKHADYSVALTMRHAKVGKDDRYYITDIRRRQVRAPDFRRELVQLHKKHPSARWRTYAAGTEMGSVDFIREDENDPVPLEALPAKGDKFTRAMPFAAAWNAGKVLLPENAIWLNEFITEIIGFTGVDDAHDDQIDAAAAAFDALDQGSGEYIPKPPKPRRPTGMRGMEM